MSANRFDESTLAVRHIRAGINGHRVAAGVQPACGGNLVSLNVDGREYIYYDEAALRGPEHEFTGCFAMFPTPCRVPDGTYEFDGRTITQRKAGELVTIHGLVRDEAFEAAATKDSIRLTLKITPGHPVHEGFPFPGELHLAMRLIECGLEYSFRYDNRGQAAAPVGFGLHPYWRIPGEKADAYLTIPCQQAMVLEDLVPTGETLPVASTELDLRRGRCLEGLSLDNVFVDRIGDRPPVLEYRGIGKRLALRADRIFSHMIVYCPPDKPAVCVESLTCAPNAVNLQHAAPEVSGLRVVQPGASLGGKIQFVVEDLSQQRATAGQDIAT